MMLWKVRQWLVGIIRHLELKEKNNSTSSYIPNIKLYPSTSNN